ncbi:MAG TPA: hypothetical protein VFW23_17865 [Tepidisphaeraceae bacterium]|nr:hypothetical protein [Tepidisphaeraceae bacterium]
MSKEFTSADWEFVEARANATAAQIRAKGATADDFAALPPIPQSQIDDFARATGYALPPDFVDLVTKFAGGWKFYWSLSLKNSNVWAKVPVDMGSFGGNAEVPFIGATAKNSLLDLYRSFQSEICASYLNDQSTIELLPALYPLHSWDGGGGDYTVLRLDVEPSRVYYLDHEIMWPIDDEHMIGRGFKEFVLGWANFGFPQCEYHSCWVNPQTQEPDDRSAKAETWRKWLADPKAI